MENFNFSISNLKVPSTEELSALIESMPMSNVFSVAEFSIAGSFTFKNDQISVTVKNELLMVFVRRLMLKVFLMNFRTGEKFSTFDMKLPATQLNLSNSPISYFSANINSERIDMNIKVFENVTPDNNGVWHPTEDKSFTVGVYRFNQEISKVYMALVDELRKLLGETDGFAETFLLLPLTDERDF